MQPKRVFIATLVVLGTLVGLYLIYQLGGLILTVYAALIFAAAIKPLADPMVARGFPRALSILLIYLTAIVTIVVAALVIVPPLVTEAAELVERIPEFLTEAQTTFSAIMARFGDQQAAVDIAGIAREIGQQLPNVATGVLSVTISAFGAVFSLVILFVIALYWSLERDSTLRFAFGFLPPEHRQRAWDIWGEIEDKMGAYVRGQLILAVVVGVLAYVGLKILGVPFTLVLAIFAGITELIPNIGPVIGAIPAVIVAFADSPTKALLVIGLYVLIQQVENNLLVPKVMERAVGMSPMVVILAVLAGGTLLGLVGAIVAVPTAAIIKVVLNHVLLRRAEQFEAAEERQALTEGKSATQPESAASGTGAPTGQN